ncbi:MAG: CdaR family protein [Deltaproteobacteria bacterium]|jgi:YbbR domain-containing protein|nr:CdaR family protein [Deltaproteobacteria bacterium]MDA8298904.1 CdaR family protein [Deltaproteobacteria bacterium]
MNRYLENLIKKNFWLKIFSLIFAVIIWAYVVGGTKQDEVATAGLIIKNLPKGYAVSNVMPKKIRVKLRGSRIDLAKINKKIFFQINGYSLLAKKNTIILGRSYLNLPNGIKVIKISPRIIPVIISRITTKYIKVLPITSGLPQKGYILKHISVLPQYVRVRGPRDIVNHLSVITTMKINIDNIDKNKTLSVSLRKPTNLLKILYNKKINVNLTVIKSSKK